MEEKTEKRGYRVILINPNLSPEQGAESLYDQIRRKVPIETLRKLEMIIEEVPLTHPLQRRYSSFEEEGSD